MSRRNKNIANSVMGLTALAGTAHVGCCVVPALAALPSGVLAGVPGGKTVEGVHDYLVERVADGVALFYEDPYKHEDHPPTFSFVPIPEVFAEQHMHAHGGVYKDEVYAYADGISLGVAVALWLPLLRQGYKRFFKKDCGTSCSH